MKPWVIEETAYHPDHVIRNGNTYLMENGYLGYRGTLEEHTREDFVACNLSGIYDRHGSSWREPVNAPNGFFITLQVNGIPLGVKERPPVEHTQCLDFRYGIHSRRSIWTVPGGSITVGMERFASMDDVHLLAMQGYLVADFDATITVTTGIDGDVWDINGPHLYDFEVSTNGDAFCMESATGELHIPVAVAEVFSPDFDGNVLVEKQEKRILRTITLSVTAGQTYHFNKFLSVYHGSSAVRDVVGPALAGCSRASSVGYEGVKAAHQRVWDRIWETCDIVIEGNDEDQRSLRYSIYHLQIIAPRHSRSLSIPARGLSGQTYKGAVFWDTELFMLPFFLHTDPAVARSLVQYRIQTLPGARRKAAEYGYRGAFYAWESQETGDDACTLFNVVDVFTKRPMRTYFRDKQIHISADIAWAIWEVYEFTGDVSLLGDGGAEVILECARFYLSYAHFNPEKKRYELLDVTGPDEYHERVNNNAYTNRMAAHVLDLALKMKDVLEADVFSELMSRLDYEDDFQRIGEMRSLLYVPSPDPETHIIEQFDRYFSLEDISLSDVKKRVLDPREYWGGGHGIATQTRIIKQADVVLMLNQFRTEYSGVIKQRNWEFYEPVTEHGSSLSACMYALLACDIGNQEWAYPYFRKTAMIDLLGESKEFAGLIYIGGTHPAANGGAWMVAVQGFAGLDCSGGEPKLRPRLPSAWKGMSFTIECAGQSYGIEITHTESRIWKK